MNSIKKIFKLDKDIVKEAVLLLGLDDEGEMINKINLSIDYASQNLLIIPNNQIALSKFFIPKVEKYYPDINKAIEETFDIISLVKYCPSNNVTEDGEIDDVISFEPLDKNNIIKVNNFCYSKESFEKYLRHWIEDHKDPNNVLDIQRNTISNEILDQYDFFVAYKENYESESEEESEEEDLIIRSDINLDFSNASLTELTRDMIFHTNNDEDINDKNVTINLRNNSLIEVDGSVFGNPRSLRLYLEYNPIEKIYSLPRNLISISFCEAYLQRGISFNLPHLKEISFVSCIPEGIEEEDNSLRDILKSIEDSISIENIIIIDCGLKTLHGIQFPISSIEITLTQNYIENLCDFDRNINLRKLDLSNNSITYAAIKQVEFPKVEDFLEIYFINNQYLSTLDERFYKSKIYIAGTSIIDINISLFGGYYERDISEYIILFSPSENYKTDKYMKLKTVLDIRYMQITDSKYESKDFKDISGYLYLSDNEIEHFLSSYCNPYLSKLDLSHNNIIDLIFLQELVFLSYANLSNNNIFYIPNLYNLQDLYYIDLSNNKIRNIDLDFLPGNLDTIILSENPIENITNDPPINTRIFLDIEVIERLNDEKWIKNIDINDPYVNYICLRI